MLRIDSLNKKIKEIDKNITLYKGEGYFYFIYDDGGKIHESHSVMTYRLNHLPEERWLDDAKDLKDSVDLKRKQYDT